MRTPSLDYLDNLISSAQKTEKELLEAASALSTHQLNWKPNATTWSVGEVVDHIITSNEAYFERLEQAIPRALEEAKFEKDPPKSNLVGKDFLKRMQPGAKKVKTYKVFEPKEIEHDPQILRKFKENQRQLVDWMEKCKGLDLNGIKIKSPLYGLIRFRLCDALNILVTHQARHTQQAKELIAESAFPDS